MLRFSYYEQYVTTHNVNYPMAFEVQILDAG